MTRTVTKTRQSANHGLHLALTIMTCGLWALVWPIIGVIGKRTKTVREIHFGPQSMVVRPVDPAESSFKLQPGHYHTPSGEINYWDGRKWTR